MDLVNLAPNGNFEYDALAAVVGGWIKNFGNDQMTAAGAIAGGIGSHSSNIGSSGVGTWQYQSDPPSPVDAGEQYSVYLHFLQSGSANDPLLQIKWLRADGSVISTTAGNNFGNPGNGNTSDVSTTATAPADAAQAVIVIDKSNNSNVWWGAIDKILFAPTAQGSTYVDGDTPPLSWTGAPGASYSAILRYALGEELYEDLQPLVDTWGDPDEALRVFCNALGAMMQPVDDIAKDGDGGEPGWSQVLDLVRAKDEWLPWLGQWVGYQVPDKAASESQTAWSARERGRIISRSTNRRGTIALLREVIQEQLTGTKNVIIQERVGGDANTINVYVNNAEIATTSAQVQAAALAAKAAGLIMNFTVLTGANYALLQASNTTYAVMTGKHANYNSVLTNPGL